MANKSVTLKRQNAGTIDVLYPTTIPEQVDGLLSGGKIAVSLLPDAVIGGMKFKGTISLSTAKSIDDIVGNLIAPGDYIIVTATGSLIQGTIATGTVQAPGDEGDSTLPVTLEAGDWIVTTAVGEQTITVAIINNTYSDASTTAAGIVELATNAETSTGTDTNRAVTPAGLASVLAGYSTTDNDRYVNTATFNTGDGILTLTRAGSDTVAVTVDLDGRYLTTQSQDFGTVTVTDTDNVLYTWASTGSAAGTTGSTLTIVDGSGVDIDVDSALNAIRISHTDTSTLTGAQGTAGIAAITVDGFGHVTGVTTATYNNYSLPLAANGTRGGIQIGATETETNRAVILTSEKASVSLPRQIPSVTLNGSSNTSPNFYAPTTVGTDNQILQSNGSGAPSWIGYEPIKYVAAAGATTSFDSGTVFLELDA
jgi:hypothetical protein